MANPYLGQIQAFGFNFAPRGWAFCNGQLLPISQNSALFSLLGTIYGGDGRTNFALPDLRGRTSLHQGRGPGLSDRRIGSRSGREAVTLNVLEIPSHNHSASANNAKADSVNPAGRVPAVAPDEQTFIYHSTPNTPMSADMIGQTGGGQSHDNMQPYLVINWCIALIGTYPSRS